MHRKCGPKVGIEYVQIHSESKLPDISNLAPFRTVIIVEEVVTQDWREKVSSWLVHSGCLYMNAWGTDCDEWDTSVDIANIEMFEPKDIPEDAFVVTTWHDNEPLEEVFWFAKHLAHHSTVKILNTVLLHISAANIEQELITKYNQA